MKKILILSFFALSQCIQMGCGGDTTAIKQEDSLRNEVFAIHDEVMPKMSDIVQLKGGLIEITTDSTNEAEIKAAQSQLEKAEDAMMVWMNNFTAPEKMRDSKSHEEIMAYLESQKMEITKVKDAMNSSIANAQRMLGEQKQ